jgi:uncharacterized protein (DUF305 family)
MTAARRCIATTLAALAVACAAVACGGSPATDMHAAHTQPSAHNADDVAFAQNMIPHHQQALDMAVMVPANTSNPDVIVMANHISSDQQAEISTMQDLLAEWGEPVAPDHGGHSGHGGMAIDGMVDQPTMNLLSVLKDADFDDVWLRSMISHHRGAVAMAQTEIARGQNPDAVKLAKIIVDEQQWEISRMSHLLTVAK